jgi:hypothetical protein
MNDFGTGTALTKKLDYFHMNIRITDNLPTLGIQNKIRFHIK